MAANLIVNKIGPGISPVTAFIFVGFDLSSKDTLQDKWTGRVVRNMSLLVLGGSALTMLINWRAWHIAIASAGAFAISMSIDTLAYHIFVKRGWRRWQRMNGSNLFGALGDSLAFPILAFGWPPMWLICVGQFVAKVVGGFLWSLIILKFNRPTARQGRTG